MTTARWGLPEQHLLPDAVVAFVDGELSPVASQRAAAHLGRCPFCAAEVSAQKQARLAVRAADTPAAPQGLLESLRSIPHDVDLPSGPDGLAMTEDGQLVVVQRPERTDAAASAGTAAGAGFGESRPLGTGPNVLGTGPVLGSRRRFGRRSAQGAGVVVSGLMIGALALATPHQQPAPSSAPASPLGAAAHSTR